MTGTFGFSYVGAVFLLCLLVPNLLWTRCRPRDYAPSGESRPLLAMERTGQVWVTCAALDFQGQDLASAASLLGVPVAGAALPVAAFFLLGIYGRAVWMLLGVTVLGIGHIGIHLRHRREIRKETNI